MTSFPPWAWSLPDRFNIGVACSTAHVPGRGDALAVIVDDAIRGVDQLTFRELAEQSDRFAQWLRDAGVAAGDRVLIRLPNCIEYPVVFLGALKRGAIPVPTSTLLTAEEVGWLARDSGANTVVTDAASWAALGTGLGQLARVLWLDQLAAALARTGHPAPAEATRADDPAYLVYTSGTTGYPKGVLHAHRALLGRQPSSEYWFDFLPAGERVLHAGKFNWTYTLGTGLTDPLYRGHTAILYEGPTGAAVWPRLIASHAATTFVAVPTIYRQIVQKTDAGRADVPTLRHCMSAGEQLSDELSASWRARFGLDVYEGLGMTECSYYICQTRQRPLRRGAAGFIQPGHEVALLDPTTWREVGTDEEGMLCIPRHDPALLLRYWNQPEETAACFHGDWFLTGDYARRDADGYVWFLGRRDDLIKSFGYRVSPHEVDRVLKGHPDVADAATAGEEIGPGKTLVVTYVVLRPAARATADDVLTYGRTRLASYKAPRRVYVVDDLPRTKNGKVLRRELRPELAHERSSG